MNPVYIILLVFLFLAIWWFLSKYYYVIKNIFINKIFYKIINSIMEIGKFLDETDLRPFQKIQKILLRVLIIFFSLLWGLLAVILFGFVIWMFLSLIWN